VISTVLHGLVLLALLWLTPLRTIILQPGKAVEFETTAGADRIEEVVAEIRDRQAEEVAFDVEELLDIAEAMEGVREAKLEDYDQFAAELVADAPNKTLAAQDEALKAQQEALEELEKAGKANEAAAGAQGEAEKTQPAAAGQAMEKARKAQDDARAAHKRARDAQVRADEAQTKAARVLAMLDETMKAAQDAQQQAISAQAAAGGAEIEAEKGQDEARNRQNQTVTRQMAIADRAKRVAELQTSVEQLAPQAKRLTDEAERAGRKAAEARKASSDARSEANRLQRAIGRATTPETQKQARAQADAAKGQAERLKKIADQAQADAKGRDDKARDARNRLTRAGREMDSAKKQIERAIAAAKTSQVEAGKLQKAAAGATDKAHGAQKRAIEAQKKARDAVGEALKGALPVAAARPEGDTGADTGRPDLFEKNVAELYDLAVGTERQSTEAYKDVRAADLAIIRQIPLAEARDQTDVAKPLRPELDRKLLTQPVRNMATADRHKKEVETAIREIRSMVTLGRRMLDMAGGAQAEGAAAMSLDWYRAKAAQQEELTRAAMEDAGAVAKDISELMKAAAGAEGGDGQGGSGTEGTPGAEGAADAGARTRSGSGGRSGRAIGPPVVERDLKAIPGRKVISDGTPAKWMYVDSWYVIGPFPNPRRINRDKKFPPESVVDLDARYVGKDGKVIRWEFMKTTEPEVLPPNPQEYAIYYAYTELWFDKAIDLWVAVGSDDKSSLWIENQPVWVSANHLKAWQVAEGMRRVHFKKGLNRVLYRIENGWKHVGWSLVIHTNSPGAAR